VAISSSNQGSGYILIILATKMREGLNTSSIVTLLFMLSSISSSPSKLLDVGTGLLSQ